MVRHYDLIVVGAGPAGLSAAVTAAKHGMHVVVFDENARPGGQLFKQIHKFFGSKEHKAKIRGIRIGQQLLDEAREAGVEVSLDSIVLGIYGMKGVSVMRGGQVEHFRGDNIILATGASENMIPFRGWTIPGVIGAGAAQTLMNLHGVRPGGRVLMVGSGNVGLVVSFQLLQAGCEVAAVIDAAPKIGGYGVHAAKVARTGVPFYLSHTVIEALGEDHVTGAVIAELDAQMNPIPGTEKTLEVDTICIAVGLSPMSQLARLAGCEMIDAGGSVPQTDAYGETSVPGIFAAGDVAGIEEASSAMITGRIAALRAVLRGGFAAEEEFEAEYGECLESLNQLRQGMFCKANKGRDFSETDEGYPLSFSLLRKGYLEDADLPHFPAIEYEKEGVHPVIECTQNIPCNPCQEVCPAGCICVGETITRLPAIDEAKKCIGCGMCVANCPGQAIFLIDRSQKEDGVRISLPYEFLPTPAVGDLGMGLSRSGSAVCEAEVVAVRKNPAFDRTVVLTIRVPETQADTVRFFRPGKEMGA